MRLAVQMQSFNRLKNLMSYLKMFSTNNFILLKIIGTLVNFCKEVIKKIYLNFSEDKF